MSICATRIAPDLGLRPDIMAVYLEDRNFRNRPRKPKGYCVPRSVDDCPNRAAFIDSRLRRTKAKVISIRDLVLVTWAVRDWSVAA